MAKKIDTSNLSVDYKQLMRMTVQDRVGLAKSGLGEELMQSLTPTQLALAFPKYYARQLPDIGRVITTGGAAPSYGGGTAPSYGGGRPSQTAAPVPSTPSGRQNPQSSSAAKENQQNEFLNEIRRQVQERQQQGTQQTNINQYQRIPGGIDRTSKLNELKDPETKKLFATMLHAEVGGYGPKDHQAFAEKVFNRAMIENKSLKQILSDKRYFEPYQNGAFRKAQQAIDNNPNLLNSHLSTIDRVGYTGVDSIRGATHNASGSVAAAVRGEKPHQKYGDFNSVKSSIVVVGRETFYSKTWEQEKIRNLPRIAASSQTSKEDATEIIPQDQSKSQSGVTTGTRSGVSGAESESQLIKRSAGVRGFTYGDRDKGGGECVKGSQGVLGALLGDTKKFSQQIGHRAAGSMTLDGGNNYLSGTGYFNSPSQMTSDYLKDPKQWRIGDTVVAQGGSRGLGHIQVWNGKAWVSDFKQPKGILVNNYSGHTLYRLNNDALSRLHPNYLKQMDGNGATSSYMSVNRINPGVSSTLGTDKEATPFSTQTEEIKKPSNYDSWPKPLQDYLKRNPDIEKEIFNAHALGVPVLDAFNKAYEKNPKLFEQSSEATADLVKTITNTPPGELPNLEQYLETGKQLSSLIEPKAVDDITKLPAANRFSKTGLDPYSMQKDIVSVKTAAGPARLHKDAAAAFTSAIQDLKDEGFPVSKLGSLNIRQKRWSSSWSEHSYGNAIDIDDRLGWTKEQLKWIKDNPGKLDQILNRYGLNRPMPDNTQEEARKSGRRYDPNHIEYRGAVTPEGLARIQEKKQKYQEYLEQKGINTKTIVTSPPPDTQTQQDQAPVPVEAVAVPSSQQLESQKPTGQQGQGASISPTRAGVSASPIKQPTATPEGYRTLEQRPTDTAGPAQKLPDTGTTEAQKVNLEQSAPPTEPGKYGGGEITDLRPNEDAYVVQAKTGQVVAQMNSKQEILAGNEVIPTRRIDNIRTEMQNDSRNIQQEQPQQQSNQPVASMTPSTQMTQTQPNIYNDTNQIYGGMIGSIYDRPASVDAAYRMARLQSNPTRENIDVGNTGYNTLA